MVKIEKEVSFSVKNGVLYSIFKHPLVNNDKRVILVMLPSPLRRQLIEVAHGSIMGGHMGVKKRTDRVLSAFYSPGIQDDVSRHCRSCDVGQKTMNKGSVPEGILSDLGTQFVSHCVKESDPHAEYQATEYDPVSSHVQWPFKEFQWHTEGHVKTPMQ